ncbi:MAG TPA: hypothetical protein VGQ83_43230 [Polyangia bacterium]|jgi:hypothetical protein
MRRLVLTWVALLVPLATAAQGLDPVSQFNAGRRAYEKKEYARALGYIRPLLYPNILLGAEEQIVDAHRVLGVSRFMTDDREAAKREFVSLLGYRPDYVLDPGADPPAAVSFFETVKRELDERARAARERQQREEERRRIEEALARRPVVYVDRTQVLERVVDRRARWPHFLPFGYGQFENGQRHKGWAFLGGQAALAATSLTAFTLFEANQGHWSPNDKSTIDALRTVQIAAGGAFFAVAIWGILDAIVYAPPRETVTVKEPRPAPPPAKAGVSLAPGGLVLRGEF